MKNLYCSLISSFLSLLLTALIIYISHKYGWYDRSDERKIHVGNIPRLGGVAIFWAFLVSIVLRSLFENQAGYRGVLGLDFLPVLVSILAVHGTGLVDDFRPMRARYKFLVQTAAAVVVVTSGFYFRYLALPFAPFRMELGVFSYPLTVLWIVGITNAVNMIDGMDGLAGGISLIAAMMYGFFYLALGESFPALIAFTLAGALAGFLLFNLPTARIFLGDAGAYFVGFVLSFLPLLHRGVHTGKLGILAAITVLIVPIYDVFAAIWRRIRQQKPIMEPDREHMHHKLLDLGFSCRQILAITYGSGILLGGVALSGLILPLGIAYVLMLSVWFLFVVLFAVLHFTKGKRLGTGARSDRECTCA